MQRPFIGNCEQSKVPSELSRARQSPRSHSSHSGKPSPVVAPTRRTRTCGLAWSCQRHCRKVTCGSPQSGFEFSGPGTSHSLVTDGVFLEESDGSVVFRELPTPTDEQVSGVALETCRRTRDILVKRGLWHDEPEPSVEEFFGTPCAS